MPGLMLDGEVFAAGRSGYSDGEPGWPDTDSAKVYVKIAPGRSPAPDIVMLALLDTGAVWSAFDLEMAAVAGVSPNDGAECRVRTSFGDFDGHIVRMPLTILADEGPSLAIEASVFLSTGWPLGRQVLGYNGLLDRIRIALDPQRSHFYFGRYQ